MRRLEIELPRQKIAEFCRKWKIEELAFFGSVLRADFRPESDVDVLITFTADAEWGLFSMASMQEELKSILGRDVDLVSRRGIEASRNPYRRNAILSSAEVIYVA